MAKMKIYEIARSLQEKYPDLKSKDLINMLQEHGFAAKSAQNYIEDEAIGFLLKQFSKKGPKKSASKLAEEKPVAEKKEKVSAPKKEEPVKKAEEPKKEEAPKKQEEKKPVEEKAAVAPAKEEKKEKNIEVKMEDKVEEKKTEVTKTENKESEKKAVDDKKEKEVKPSNNQADNRRNENHSNGGNREGSYNRNNNGGNREGSYNRNNNGGNREGGYNRNNNGGNREGGYNRNNNGGNREGGYNRNNNGGNREGGYNRNNNGGNREGGYNRNNNGGNREGGYNRNNNGGNREGGYNRNGNGGQGGYNRNGNGGQGGYNRNGNGGQGSYNRNGNGGQGGYNRNGNGGQGGYNRNGNGGQGGYNRNGNGGQGGYNRNGNGGQGGYNRNGNGGGQGRSFGGGIDAVKPEVKQSRQLRANKDSRSAKQRHGRDRERDDFDPLYADNRRPRKKKDPNRKGAFIKPEPIVKPKEPEDGIKTITLPEKLTIKELADAMKVPPATVIKNLFLKGNVVSMNHEITYDEAEEIALEYNCIAEKEVKVDLVAELLKEDEEDASLLQKRPPVVCVMGHVDHGKTSLLDAIRETHVTTREAGGITQHIGAYVSEINDEKITFLDTPGHEAFTSMRMRGAQATDIAVLVVAADDGVMPQTIEAINHAKAAGVEIIVAVNKIDKPSANIERVKQELVEYGLVAEDWGGDTIFVPVSAHTKEGIDTLLEMIVLTAEVLELKANPDRLARGVVIEAQLDKGRGPVATILVQKGTLHVGDNIAVGAAYGKIRAMMDAQGHRVKEALPSTPVEILGLHDVPEAGEIFMATETDKEARNISETYINQGREKMLDETKAKLTLDGLFDQIQAGNVKELNLIVKADVQGSVEAVKQSLLKLSNDEVAVRIIHAGVGAINESDVSLASASNAIIIGFNIRPDNMAKEVADREKVDVRLYRVIYDAIEDIEHALKGMLEPIFEEKVIAHLEVRQTFKASGIGIIAGSYVLDGKITRGCKVRISREGEQIYEGNLASLKRFKDDVKEVASGYECGLVFEDFNGIQEEDQIEAYTMVEVPR